MTVKTVTTRKDEHDRTVTVIELIGDEWIGDGYKSFADFINAACANLNGRPPHWLLGDIIKTTMYAAEVGPQWRELGYDLVFNWGEYFENDSFRWSLVHHDEPECMNINDISTFDIRYYLQEHAINEADYIADSLIDEANDLSDDDWEERYEEHEAKAAEGNTLSELVMEKIVDHADVRNRREAREMADELYDMTGDEFVNIWRDHRSRVPNDDVSVMVLDMVEDHPDVPEE